MARKTYPVEDLKAFVNNALASVDSLPEGRVAASVILERVLMDTGNYKGFQYVLPGGEQVPIQEFVRDYDATRRRYY
jgi:hypothetical protein